MFNVVRMDSPPRIETASKYTSNDARRICHVTEPTNAAKDVVNSVLAVRQGRITLQATRQLKGLIEAANRVCEEKSRTGGDLWRCKPFRRDYHPRSYQDRSRNDSTR